MARRVPQRQRITPRRQKIERSNNEGIVRLALLLVCGLTVAAGFVYAGRQHFMALNYGYKTEELRRERDRLLEEQRRYLLQREAASSPVHLEEAAKRLGMQPLQAAQIDPLHQPKDSETPAAKPKTINQGAARDGLRAKPAPAVSLNHARKPI